MLLFTLVLILVDCYMQIDRNIIRCHPCVGQPQGYSGPAETAQASYLPGEGALQLSSTWTRQRREGGGRNFYCISNVMTKTFFFRVLLTCKFVTCRCVVACVHGLCVQGLEDSVLL